MIDIDKSKVLVTIIIPCRNEERFIGKCLDSIIANDYPKDNHYPKDKLEVLIVDGMSNDGTREVIKGYLEQYPFIRILDNPKKITPVAMNIGITKAKGDFVVMINSHAIIDRNFLKNGIECIQKTNANAVGGRLNTINEGEGIMAKAIPLSTDSIFGAGGRRYRSRNEEGFVSDTLPYCIYPKEVFTKIGLIDEELIRDQDEEFNYRLIKSGGKIFYSPSIKSLLHLRPNLPKLWHQHLQYGYFKVRVAQKVGTILTWRQLIPCIFVTTLLIAGILSILLKPFVWLFLVVLLPYIITNLGFSFFIAIKNGLKLFVVLPLVFAVLHFSYGLGYLMGIWDFIILRRHLKGQIKDMELSR